MKTNKAKVPSRVRGSRTPKGGPSVPPDNQAHVAKEPDPSYRGAPDAKQPSGGLPGTPKRGSKLFTRNENRIKAPGPRKPRKPREVLSWWYAIRTHSGRERYARKMIERTGHIVWAPFIEEEGVKHEVPLFPGHIFVLGPDWYYLQQTPGVMSIITMGPSPARMPIKEMRTLMKRANKQGVITIKKQKFVGGQEVRVRRGSWQGHSGVYIRATGPERVRVLMRLLGGVHEFEFDHAAITAADGQDGADKVHPDGGATSK